MGAAASTASSLPLERWTAEQVASAVASCGGKYEGYGPAIVENGINGDQVGTDRFSVIFDLDVGEAARERAIVGDEDGLEWVPPFLSNSRSAAVDGYGGNCFQSKIGFDVVPSTRLGIFTDHLGIFTSAAPYQFLFLGRAVGNRSEVDSAYLIAVLREQLEIATAVRVASFVAAAER